VDGAVQSWEDRELAMQSAWGIRDMKNVVNNIHIAPSGEAYA
jgi:osmotically-inducible protein OsmY